MRNTICNGELEDGGLRDVIDGFNDNFERLHKALLFYIDRCEALEKRIEQLESKND